MKSTNLIRLGLTLAAAVPLFAQAAPLNVKPGAWESTMTSTSSGLQNALPPETLSQMTPEQRDRLTNPPPITMTQKSCIKDTDSIDKNIDESKLHMKCERKNVKKTANSYEADMACTQTAKSGKKMTINAHFKVEAESSERMVSTSDTEASNGIKSHAVIKSHWVAASCAGIAEAGR